MNTYHYMPITRVCEEVSPAGQAYGQHVSAVASTRERAEGAQMLAWTSTRRALLPLSGTLRGCVAWRGVLIVQS